MHRYVIYFTGNVPGVGFRATAKRCAERYDLTGNVSNLPNGQVQIVAEGQIWEIGYMLIDLMTAFAGHITEIDMTIEPHVEQRWPDFAIVGPTEENIACLDSQ